MNRVCQWCGADISHRAKQARFCEKRSCWTSYNYHKNRSEIRRRQNQKKRDLAGCPHLEERTCKHDRCGKVFDATHARQVYCSTACRNRASYQRKMVKEPEKVRESNAKWRAENAEKRAQIARERRAADPEHHRRLRMKWLAKNKDKVRHQNRERYWSNPEKFKANQNERNRRRATDAAISMLILPIKEVKE